MTYCLPTGSDILLWDAQTLMWEAKGPYAIAVDDNEAVIWDDKNVLRIGIVRKFRLDLKKILT